MFTFRVNIALLRTSPPGRKDHFEGGAYCPGGGRRSEPSPLWPRPSAYALPPIWCQPGGEVLNLSCDHGCLQEKNRKLCL